MPKKSKGAIAVAPNIKKINGRFKVDYNPTLKSGKRQRFRATFDTLPEAREFLDLFDGMVKTKTTPMRQKDKPCLEDVINKRSASIKGLAYAADVARYHRFILGFFAPDTLFENIEEEEARAFVDHLQKTPNFESCLSCNL